MPWVFCGPQTVELGTEADAAVCQLKRDAWIMVDARKRNQDRPIAPGTTLSPLPPWDPMPPGAFFLRWR